LTQKAATDTTRDLRSKVHRQTPGHRSVSLFWHEKGRMIFDTFQILGLLWASYGAWPASWLLATQWTTLFAGDVLSFTEYHSAAVTALPLPTNWSEAKASYWALYLPVVCIGVPLLLYCLPRCCCCCATSPSAALSYVVRLAELMYLPIVLCLLELGTCRGRIDQWTFPNDALSCWGWFGTTVEMSGGGGGSGGSTVWYVYLYVYAIPVFSLMVALVFLLWVPLRINKYIDVLHVYTDSRQHERYINAKELEYLLYINTDYEDEHFSTVTSFKRECFNNNDNNDKHTGHKWFGAGAGGVCSHFFVCFFFFCSNLWFYFFVSSWFGVPGHAIHQRTRLLYLKFLLTLVRVGLVGYNLHTWTMVVLGGVLLLWAIVQTLSPPYRVWSSNVTHLSLTWMLVGLSAMGALRQRGMYAALILDVTIVPILVVVSITGKEAM